MILMVVMAVSKGLYNASISLDGKKNRLRVSVDAIRQLGMPSHICIRCSDSLDAIVIAACEGKYVMSFKVPERMLRVEDCPCEITSKQFIHMLMTANQLEHEKTYRFPGEMSESGRYMRFCISKQDV